MPLKASSWAEAAMRDFSGFYTAHFGRIAAQLYAYLGDRSEAQDLTQEAFCRAFERWEKLSSYERPEAWVRHVAWNLATNRLRQLRTAVRHLARERVEHVEGPSPDRIVLMRALAELPANHRLAIVLHDLAGLSTSEIAEQRGVAEGTVRSWLSRGRARMAEQLIEAPRMEEDVSAPGLDFSRVRRQRAIRRGALAAILAVLVTLPIAIILRGKGSEPPFIGPTNPPASPSPSVSPTPVSSCVGTPLPGITGAPVARVWAGEPTGRYVVGAYSLGTEYASQEDRVVLWADGVPTVFTPPDRHLTGLAVNSRGVVAGSSNRDIHSGFSVWTYHGGQLEVVMRNEARPVAGNNARGDILLKSERLNVPSAVRLAGPRPVLRELSPPDGVRQTNAIDLGEDGTVIGSAGDGRALYWTPDQVAHRLNVPDGWTSSVVAVSGQWVVGFGYPGARIQERQVMRWNLRTGEVFSMPELDYANDITAYGWVFGLYRNQAVLAMDGKQLELPPVAGEPAADVIAQLFSTSADGRIINGMSRVAGVYTPTTWRCS